MTAAAPSRTGPARPGGRTQVSDRAVTKIACHAAEEVPEVTRVERGRRAFGGGSSATVRVDHVTVDLRVTVAYPAPLRTVADAVRQHVAARVHELTGLPVTRVDLTLADLTPPPGTTFPGDAFGTRPGEPA